MSPQRIKKLLVANRGEIAVRVIRACRELGIATVAVASRADRTAYFARCADQVVEIGEAPAAESYLVAGRILEAARATGADAIHPGYGFLSENASFAAAVESADIAFVGPPPAAMAATGDKTSARLAMEKAGVPVVPGWQGDGTEPLETLEREARRVGFPLLVKAAAGGGGKGMRIVRSAGDLAEALEGARREATKAFGDSRVFLERLVEDARHVEIQVLGDAYGTVVHLFERECSVQRRYQKIVEETPSAVVDPALRERMGAAAVAACHAVGYVNAGTVEFLVGPDGSFYFLEMNTRLQVEHPVTELVTGVDLVQAQIRIAAGERLAFGQEDLRQRGHAIECRLYAEDPGHGFAPSTGRIEVAVFPSGPGVRVDAGLEAGDEVSRYYDPMIAKLAVHAEDRGRAIHRMERALAETVVLGVATNLAHLRAVLGHPTFRAGRATTTFVERELASWRPPSGALPDDAILAMAMAEALSISGPAVGAGPGDADRFSPWARSDGWRLGGS